MCYLYIIRNDTNKRFHIGVTKNIDKRVDEHNNSRRVSITHFGRYHLVYKEKYSSFKEARKREQQVKSYKGGNAFKKLLREKANITW